MRPASTLLCVLLLVAAGSSSRGGAVVREEGVIYLEDFLRKPIKLQVLQPTAIYYDSSMGRYLGTLSPGQFVELQAIADHAYRVRGRAQQGGVAGWILPRTVSALQPGLVENLRANAKRIEQVKELIARNEVAINMTPQEVVASLGKPHRKSSRIDSGGRGEVWEYVRYERVPRQVQGYDAYGRLVVNYIYVKEPVGQLAVIFENSLVSALEQSEGTLTRAEATRIVSRPIEVY